MTPALEREILAHAAVLDEEGLHGDALARRAERVAAEVAAGRTRAAADAALDLLLRPAPTEAAAMRDAARELAVALVALDPPADLVARVSPLLPVKARAQLAYADAKASTEGPAPTWDDLAWLVADPRLGAATVPLLRSILATPALATVCVRADPHRAVEVLAALARNGAVTDAELRAACLEHPRLAAVALRSAEPRGHGRTTDAFWARLCACAQDAAWARAARLAGDDMEFLMDCAGLAGSRFVLRAAEVARDAKLKRLRHPCRTGSSAPVEAACARLAAARVPDDERAALAEALRAFPPRTLELLLPVASHARGALCEARGWPGAAPLAEWVARVARLDPLDRWAGVDVGSSSDPTVGVVSAREVRAMVEQAGERVARRVVELYDDAGGPTKNTCFLLEAAAGWNRDETLAKLAKRNQVALRAYGLLPLEGEADLLARFVAIKAFEREATQFGPERQASETAAARAALANLAANAGHADATRLEWAMEARAGPGGPAAWAAGDHEVLLVVEDGEPALAFRHAGKPVRALPAALRKHAGHAEAKAALAAARAQRTRLRATFERMMISGERIAADEARLLSRIPLAAWMLQRLVLADDAGRAGTLAPDGERLVGVDGEAFPLPRAVRIAHPLDLAALGAWRARLLAASLAQPFKQAFRETYAPVAPREGQAEVEAFQGRQVDTRVAARLLQSRGWELPRGDVAEPFRAFREAGVVVRWSFPDAGHFLAERPSATTGPLAFSRAGAGSVPLADVPPVVYSEACRDADLVAAVAGFEPWATPEAVARRRDLVRAVAEAMRLANVTLEDDAVAVRGRLARYRVRLRDGTTTLEPLGEALDLPEGWGTRAGPDRWALGEEEGDEATVEVLGRVLRLAEDDRIRDEDVLRRIRRAPRG